MSNTRKKIRENTKIINDRNTTIEKTFILPDGLEKTFTIRSGNIWVHTFGITEDNKIIITKQFRPGPEEIFFEIPGGKLEKGETIAEGAKREFNEETGYDGEFKQIAMWYTSPYSDFIQYLFIAKNCKIEGPQKLDDSEFIEIEIFTIKELLTLISGGNFLNSQLVYKALDYLGYIKISG